jgi:hypothetical protein
MTKIIYGKINLPFQGDEYRWWITLHNAMRLHIITPNALRYVGFRIFNVLRCVRFHKPNALRYSQFHEPNALRWAELICPYGANTAVSRTYFNPMHRIGLTQKTEYKH